MIVMETEEKAGSLEKKALAGVELLEDRLIPFGFIKENGVYRYAEMILDGAFRAEIRIDGEMNVSGDAVDLETGEVYMPLHVPSLTGGFAGEVRSAYREVLQRIGEACGIPQPFDEPQANRIAAVLYRQYGDRPDHVFRTNPAAAVFRHPDNHKWYALFMETQAGNLRKDKEKGSGRNGQDTVMLITAKTEPARISDLMRLPSVYPGFHMNHKNWVSIVTGEGMDDAAILKVLEESRQLAAGKAAKSYARSEGPKSWLIPSNPSMYDVAKGFAEGGGELFWHQNADIRKGDVVCIYQGAPVSAVMFRCLVTEADVPADYIFNGRRHTKMIRLRLLHTYDRSAFPLQRMRALGVRGVRGPRGIPEALREALEAAAGE